MPSPVVAKSPLGMHAEEKPPLRACDVAEDHFRRELALHEGMAGAANAGTLVIIHDQCYGHRYARPKTSKATLNTIMERPERMLASVRGIATAYVRLGGRHCEGSNPPVPNQTLPERIPFQIRKTSRAVDLTSQAVTNVHGTKWMDEFQKLCESAEGKLATTGKELARDPPTAPGQPPKRQFHPMDLYLCSESLNAIQGALGGVMDAVDAVFQGSSIDNGVSRAFVCIRPPGHHCSAEWPSGFCWINNVHVGIEHAMMNYGLTHAAIVDFDLHHGDGSQSITWGRNKKVQAMHKNTPNWKKTSVGYFSLHDINSFPCEDGDDDKVQAASLCIDNAHGQSVWNIHLETWSTPDEFWTIYEEKYLVLLEKTRKYLKFHTNRLRKSPNHPTPKAAIFLSAGFDASEWETAGMQRHRVNVPTEFYARFTRDVVKLAEEADTGVDGRIISVLEGGYSDRALSSGVLSHLSGLCDGQVWSDSTPSGGLAFDMQRRMKALSVRDEDDLMNGLVAPVTYDPRWWDEARLAELENLVAPPLVVAPKKMRTGPPAHFSSPTQSFTAKVVDPAKLHRTVSGRYPSVSPSRAPTPPPPDVDWATASHALSKLLIPSDRQTQSCRPEELTEPRIKKEKPAPTLASVHVDPSGRQLRGRRPVATYTDAGSDDETPSVRPESRTSRRRTIADLPLPTTEPPEATRSVSRRMSIASTSSSVAGDRSTSRASSVVPGRRSVAPAASTNGVQVKKARGTTTAASRIPKNQPPPVPRVPSNYLSKTASSKEKEPQKEKENDIDQLTSGLKRITLKLPSKEEHDAREKAREAERKAKTTRKPAMPKTAKVTATKPAATKRAAGRPAKMTKPPVPLEPAAPVQALKEPNLEAAAAAPLEQPQPVVPVEAPAVPEQAAVAPPIGPAASTAEVATGPPRRQSGLSLVAEPPTDLIEMSLTPDQLPKPSFVNIVRVESPVMKTTPPRPDTPPPPPPSTIPQFVPQNPHTFGVASPPSQMFAQSASPWGAAVPPPAPVSAMGAPRPVSAAGKRADLPVFTANGVIPFAPAPNVAVPNGQPNMVAGSDATRVKEEESRKDIWEVPETPAR
ncbi:Arginase/deacetylase [Lentithecium fluviatile CBS 122367]|uniref:Arginase/deacetylase n=1 Tax=Lentithecium fluviatile CBS 122367 TaxID=1168545 RepID=A0A6G1IDE5_9PLEO|nr:Arginase/deacetylase [Lentithecium fluviatile CBS 122367]